MREHPGLRQSAVPFRHAAGGPIKSATMTHPGLPRGHRRCPCFCSIESLSKKRPKEPAPPPPERGSPAVASKNQGNQKKGHEVSWTFSPRSYGNARRKSGMPRKQGRSFGTRNSVGLAPTKDQRQNTLTYEPRSTSSPLRLRRHARGHVYGSLSPVALPHPHSRRRA